MGLAHTNMGFETRWQKLLYLLSPTPLPPSTSAGLRPRLSLPV